MNIFSLHVVFLYISQIGVFFIACFFLRVCRAPPLCVKLYYGHNIMILPYFAGFCLGMCLGKANEREYRSYYYFHTEKIRQLENKITKYERLFGKIN
jgi:hypothetical protein